MSENFEVSILRLYIMRSLYLIDFVLFGLAVWPGILRHGGLGDPLQAVAICFWAALSMLAGLGIRYPVKMLPLLLLQLLYKSIWLIAVALPLWVASHSTTYLNQPMLVGSVLDMIAIPWLDVFTTYVIKRGDSWK